MIGLNDISSVKSSNSMSDSFGDTSLFANERLLKKSSMNDLRSILQRTADALNLTYFSFESNSAYFVCPPQDSLCFSGPTEVSFVRIFFDEEKKSNAPIRYYYSPTRDETIEKFVDEANEKIQNAFGTSLIETTGHFEEKRSGSSIIGEARKTKAKLHSFIVV